MNPIQNAYSIYFRRCKGELPLSLSLEEIKGNDRHLFLLVHASPSVNSYYSRHLKPNAKFTPVIRKDDKRSIIFAKEVYNYFECNYLDTRGFKSKPLSQFSDEEWISLNGDLDRAFHNSNKNKKSILETPITKIIENDGNRELSRPPVLPIVSNPLVQAEVRSNSPSVDLSAALFQVLQAVNTLTEEVRKIGGRVDLLEKNQQAKEKISEGD